MSFYDDVYNFHDKFDLPREGKVPPAGLDPDTLAYRVKFLIEELSEFCDAYGMRMTRARLVGAMDECETDAATAIGGINLEGAADALADLCYVVLGTAQMMGLPFNAIWDEVQRANMEKVRAESADDDRSKRNHAMDVVKPKGWQPPNVRKLIDESMERYRKGEG